METFGLTRQVEADPNYVRQQLAENDAKLRGVIEAMYDTVHGALNDNSRRIQKVTSRLVTSVRGHLRRNNGIMNEVNGALKQGVQQALDANTGMIGLISADPAIRDQMRAVPPSPNPGAYTPQPPVAPPAAQPFGLPPLPVSITGQTYTILANADCSQLVAVPGDMGDWYRAEWQPPPGWFVQETLKGTPEEIGQRMSVMLCRKTEVAETV